MKKVIILFFVIFLLFKPLYSQQWQRIGLEGRVVLCLKLILLIKMFFIPVVDIAEMPLDFIEARMVVLLGNPYFSRMKLSTMLTLIPKIQIHYTYAQNEFGNLWIKANHGLLPIRELRI